MSRPLLALTVALASYGVLTALIAAFVMIYWRWRGKTLHSASAVAVLRLLPAALSALATAIVVVPAFLIFEPIRDSEPVGPFLTILALLSLAMIVSSLAVGMRTLRQTGRLARMWLQSAQPLRIDAAPGITTYVIDSVSPIVAVIGVFSPRLVAARAVVDACSREELAVIVAHEQGHLRAGDNLKRWLLDSTPDVLRWTRIHHEMLLAWRDASEDAADDAAAPAAPEARANLAALLVKVARLTADAAPTTVSAFAGADGLERRVRRLLSEPAEPAGALRPEMAVLAAVTAVVVLTLTQPAALRGIYDVLEIGVRFGL